MAGIPTLPTRQLIGGAFEDGGGAAIPVINPRTGEALSLIHI